MAASGDAVLSTPLSSSRLFVVGPARNGTTVLQDALNSSPDVYLFGEPDFHLDQGASDFAARYNAMHRQWQNQATKSTFCPELFAQDASWPEYLTALSRHYRLVGSKIVTHGSADPTVALPALFRFQCRHFYTAHYVFTFKEPASVIASSRSFQMALEGTSSSFDQVLRNYVETIGLYVLMKRTLPNVHVVFHGGINEATFAILGTKLGVDLSDASAYYDGQRVVTYDVKDLQREHGRVLELVALLLEDLRRGSEEGFGCVYLAQNNRNVMANHLTLLGGIQRRVDFISDALARGAAHTL